MTSFVGYISESKIIIVSQRYQATLTPDRARRQWQVDLPHIGKRFFLQLNTPLLAILEAIDGAGGER